MPPQCHSFIHRLWDNSTLGHSYYTQELIMADGRVQKWVSYASKQKGVAPSRAANNKLHYAR